MEQYKLSYIPYLPQATEEDIYCNVSSKVEVVQRQADEQVTGGGTGRTLDTNCQTLFTIHCSYFEKTVVPRAKKHFQLQEGWQFQTLVCNEAR